MAHQDPPQPLTAAVRARFQRQRTYDTAPEMALRRELHRRGLRYRVNMAPLAGRRRADVIFPRVKVAVFVDGCFWHRCPDHGLDPKHNSGWWRDKLDRNVARDREVDAQLRSAGWTVIRIWEHEDPERAADGIEALVRTP